MQVYGIIDSAKNLITFNNSICDHVLKFICGYRDYLEHKCYQPRK